MFEALYCLLFKLKTVFHLFASILYWRFFKKCCTNGFLVNKFNTAFQILASLWPT